MSSHSQSIKRKIKNLIITSIMATLLLLAQLVFSFLPNIELVSFLLIIFTLHFPVKQVLFASYVFCLLEGLFFGFGIWWFMYLYVWQILILLTSLFKKIDSSLMWAIISGSFGLFFGALCSVPYFFVGGIGFALTWWLSGLPFDVLHCIGNSLVILVLFKPINIFFSTMKTKNVF